MEVSLPANVSLQLDCVACKAANLHRHTMHVQGLSHWAPANIGPYSQAVKVTTTIPYTTIAKVDAGSSRFQAKITYTITTFIDL